MAYNNTSTRRIRHGLLVNQFDEPAPTGPFGGWPSKPPPSTMNTCGAVYTFRLIMGGTFCCGQLCCHAAEAQSHGVSSFCYCEATEWEPLSTDSPVIECCC